MIKILLATFLFLGVITHQALIAKTSLSDAEDITFTYSEKAEIEGGTLFTDDESIWKLLEAGPDHFAGTVVVLHRKGTHSGIAYFDGESIPVTLLSGEPDIKEGFRTSLLFTDTENRRLTLTDGTTRRVLDPEADLAFSSQSLVELIITRDRRYAIDLDRGLRIAVSPPMRNQ